MDTDRCTCDRQNWPKGGDQDPDFPDIYRDVGPSKGGRDPTCPIHGDAADGTEDPSEGSR